MISPESNNINRNEISTKSEMLKLLFPEKLHSIEELDLLYPPRNLPENSIVTRVAPSPTGFMHIGGLYTGLISERIAHQSPAGVFYLRVEDTDRAREVKGATELIISSFETYGIDLDEGPNITGDRQDVGEYGPYIQSEREKIYKSVVKNLVEKGLAYPCFCSSGELEEIRKKQEDLKIKPGYYGEWAKWRNASKNEVFQRLSKGDKCVIRIKSKGKSDGRFVFDDAIKGKKELPENDQDIVILKSDGLPTYHFAHAVDDHFMDTTHVIRADEWFSSCPIHVELFNMLGWKLPVYGHIAPIQKMDGESKRKLSKRKDPEASIVYYDTEGYPREAIIEYMLNLANSNFEDWRRTNADKSYKDFPFSLKKLGQSAGPLFDANKLRNISKDVISKMSADEIYSRSFDWALEHDKELSQLMDENREYIIEILNIERVGTSKIRKDIETWSDIRKEVSYFFKNLFFISDQEIRDLLPGTDMNVAKKIAQDFRVLYDSNDSKEAWFEKLKRVAVQNGYSPSPKEYKNNPGASLGQISDVAKIFRVLLAGRVNTPDLHSIMRVLGLDESIRRLNRIEQIKYE